VEVVLEVEVLVERVVDVLLEVVVVLEVEVVEDVEVEVVAFGSVVGGVPGPRQRSFFGSSRQLAARSVVKPWSPTTSCGVRRCSPRPLKVRPLPRSSTCTVPERFALRTTLPRPPLRRRLA